MVVLVVGIEDKTVTVFAVVNVIETVTVLSGIVTLSISITVTVEIGSVMRELTVYHH